MFEKSFKRPRNYFRLSSKHQYEVDKKLGILNWDGTGIKENEKLFKDHYDDPRSSLIGKNR